MLQASVFLLFVFKSNDKNKFEEKKAGTEKQILN